MNVADSSVVVPGLLPWHEHHGPARTALDSCDSLISHVALETYSVLTRLPEGMRVAPDVARTLLQEQFPGPSLGLTARQVAALLDRLARASVTGGAVYDAVVAASAERAGARLLTRDRRALVTYAALGIDVDVV